MTTTNNNSNKNIPNSENLQQKKFITDFYDNRQINGQVHVILKERFLITTDGPEICIQNLPASTTTEDIMAMFLRFGTIEKMRFLVDFEGKSRGICYIKYLSNLHNCDAAIKRYNSFRYHGNELKVFKSSNHRNLVISNVNENVPDEEIEKLIRAYTFPNFIYIWNYRKFKHVLIRYCNHQDAVKFRRILCNFINALGTHVSIVWFKESGQGSLTQK